MLTRSKINDDTVFYELKEDNGEEKKKVVISKKFFKNQEHKFMIPDEYKNDEEKILNTLINPSFMKYILKTVIRKLIKEYKDDEEKMNGNFITDTMDTTYDNDNVYDKFLNEIDNINAGNIFNNIPLDENEEKLVNEVNKDEINVLLRTIKEIKKELQSEKYCPSLISGLKKNVDIEKKIEYIKNYYLFSNSELLSDDYNFHLNKINEYMNLNDDMHKQDMDMNKKIGNNLQLNARILKLDTTEKNKMAIYSKWYQYKDVLDGYSDESGNARLWFERLLTIPFNKYRGLNERKIDKIIDLRKELDESLLYLETPKDLLLNMLCMGDNSQLKVLGLYGNAGVGKTKFVETMSKILNRPYKIIPLGGVKDPSVLFGHLETYIGSKPGMIVDTLINTECMNPIILLDELDKVESESIYYSLINLTDPNVNKNYNGDQYFNNISFDLSKVLFVFTYNARKNVNKILLDRIYEIKIDNYTNKEKMEIIKQKMIPEILEYYTQYNLEFNDETINELINIKKNSLRDIKRYISLILSRIITLKTLNKNQIKLSYNTLYEYYNSNNGNVIKKEHVLILLKDIIYEEEKPPIGMYL
jgi:ATP-dependent Lon protease